LSEFKEIDCYPVLDKFVEKEGVIVYWDPKDEGFIDRLATLTTISQNIALGCVDLLRCFYLAPGNSQCAQIYLQGECVSTVSLDELETALADLQDVRDCIAESLIG